MFKHQLFALLFLSSLPALALAEDHRPTLIRIHDIAPRIAIDMRYASPNNFTGQTLYPVAECMLCEPTAHRLARVQAKLEKQGLGLKVWDCYRPLSVQKILWARVPDDRYVANPDKGSRHNRGASVDLTLIDKDGREIAMPTPFDEFSERAHRDFMDLPPEILKNRKTLEDAMESEGFVGLPTEWWHFDDPEWRNFSLRDDPLGSASLSEDKPGVKGPPIIPAETRELILVLSPTWKSTTGVLRRFERNESWKLVQESSVSLGAHGMAWGRGVNSLDWKGPVKKEGDMKTPAGIFRIGIAYGPNATPPPGTSWPYQSVDERWFCVDDPTSTSYNHIVTTSAVTKDWKSAEVMRRSDSLYNWVINIEQNWPDVKSRCGSCIFFHVWRKPGGATEGCVAMSEADIRTLLSWLKPDDKPLAVFLTREAYEVLKEPWGLP